MRVDKKTLQDLAIWDKNGGVIDLLDHCITTGGSQYLKLSVQSPPQNVHDIRLIQDAVKDAAALLHSWPKQLNNGMVMMVDKFFTSAESIISKPNTLSLVVDQVVKKIVPRNEQSLIKFSITQVIDFIKACDSLIKDFGASVSATIIKDILDDMARIISQEHFQRLAHMPEMPTHQSLMLAAYHTRKYLKAQTAILLQHVYKLDYLRSLACAMETQKWTMPVFVDTPQTLYAEDLYHPLLQNPISYKVDFSNQKNFLFITGANMSGKSTFMKSLGIAAFLAHLGCGVPAKQMKLSFINALITNMQIEDNIYTGESYFLAEVLRMKNTALQIRDQDNNLVLMDELFKGTNIHDAYDCTQTVIEALMPNKKNLYCLSTHLYELGHQLTSFPNIIFKFFETVLDEKGGYAFSYQMKEGVSNDKIGYMVLKKEGVIDILNNS